jgi:hypothetical protein
MKRILLALAIVATLSGCMITDPYYVQPQPVYVQPRPIYIPPPVYYRPSPPPPRCYWSYHWDPYYRMNRSTRVCR